MKHALEARGVVVVPIFPKTATSRAHLIRGWIRDRTPKGWLSLLRRFRSRPKKVVDEDSVLVRAEALSIQLAAQVASHDLDALFGCCVSVPLFRLETDLPIVYYSDTTARLINEAYPEYRSRSEAYKAACNIIEHVAITKSRVVVLATQLARRSAVEHYGADPAVVHVVPLGVNAVSPATRALPFPVPPTREELRLVMTAADPVRKRSDFAVEVVAILRDRGWNATLDLIGRTTPRALASKAVRCAGWIDPSSSDGSERICALMASSHIMILPSIAEAFGIAPGEAAHAGRTSIVSAAGGLPEAVIDGEGGIVMPLDALPSDYADAIEQLALDPSRYLELCRSARARARRLLTWEHWGESVHDLIAAACHSKSGG